MRLPPPPTLRQHPHLRRLLALHGAQHVVVLLQPPGHALQRGQLPAQLGALRQLLLAQGQVAVHQAGDELHERADRAAGVVLQEGDGEGGG